MAQASQSQCPACGAGVRAGASFCGACGHALGTAPMRSTEARRARPPRARTVECVACGAALRAGAEFCSKCGAPQSQDSHADRGRTRRAGRALITVFLGTLALLLLTDFLPWNDELELSLAFAVGSGLIALIAGFMLGDDALPEIFGESPRAGDWLLAPLVGWAALAISTAYVAVLLGLAGEEFGAGELEGQGFEGIALLLFLYAVLPPFTEELLDRGVLWVALERVVSPAQTLLLTSLLFALSHGFNGGAFLEIPHRFAAGLLFGWLRLRTGSLAPCILAHAVLNGTAVLLDV